MIPCCTLNCWHVNTWSGSRSLHCPLFTARIHFAVWNCGRGCQRCSSGVEGRSKQLHVPVSTLHLGGCGWHHSEITVTSTVQAVSLQRPSWTTGLICLYYTLPSYDLIWLNDCLRKEDWPKLQLGILFAPVFVLSFDWTLSQETS